MARHLNPKLIGGFAVGAIALVIIGMLALGGGQFLGSKDKAVLFFQDSLSGLDTGSPVTIRGVMVGSVTGIVVQYDVKNRILRVPVHIEIDTEKVQVIGGAPDVKDIKKLVAHGLRAQLELQSLLTGQASINFDFHPGTPIRLVGADPGVLELPTIPSDIDALKANASSVLAKINKLPLEQIAAQILDTVRAAGDTLRSIQSASDRAGGLVADVHAQVKPLSDSLMAASGQARLTLKEAQSRLELRAGEPLQSLNETLVDARRLVDNVDGNLPQLIADAQRITRSASGALDQAESTLRTAQRAISPDSPLYVELNSTLQELRTAATAIRVFAEYIERNPGALLTGKH
jgi:phospholipid/cholesterol/gamma-HCH transport system substrate-binding protein